MHISSRPAARIAAATALLAAGAVLAGCGPAAPPGPSGSTAPPAASATSVEPTPTASATPTPTSMPMPTPTPTPSPTQTEAAGEVFETQNGTMRLPLPDGWTARDQSRLSADHSGRPMWENLVDFESPAGTQLGYSDGFGGNVGFFRTDFGIVEERPTQIAADVAAMSWWVQDSGRYFVHAAVATRSSEGTEPIPEFVLPGVERNHMFTMVLFGESQPSVASVDEAEQLLSSAQVREALDVMADLELTGVPGSAMPPGVDP